jgi:O-acetyl-ADP-ribose deacetylase
MQHRIDGRTLELARGDIVEQDVDAIVNAANTSLLGGGGVDGAIHRAAGPELLAECRTLGGCPTGQARITRGYRLRARHVIHAVGPRYRGGTHGEADLLASAYCNSLALAAEHELDSVALPAISAGIYGYPLDEAATIAIRTALDHLRALAHPSLIRFVLFDDAAYESFSRAIERLATEPSAVSRQLLPSPLADSYEKGAHP